MSESMSGPWIRDYLVGVAEAHGAQLYNAPESKAKKKVQLTDFLSYQDDSYVWAWISDKDYSVSVRISKDAAAAYKIKQRRSIFDCRLCLIFITSYRPMFSPRPLGPNVTGNTPLSHISLEIGCISFLGFGGHLFGNPRDLELDEKIKEWVVGLRQDGGGGNVLKLRKELAQSQRPLPSPPSPPPLSLYAPVSQHLTTQTTRDVAKPKVERTRDFKRTYTKRWRKIEIDPWKLATKPETDGLADPTEPNHSFLEPSLDAESRIESRDHKPLVCPSPPQRTPRPTSPRRQGTPTDWSPSNRGSPSALSGNDIQQLDEPNVLPTLLNSLSNTGEKTEVDTATVSDVRSLQPPTPAQRTKRSPLPCSSSPPCSSPQMFVCTPVPPSQRTPRSSPPPPSSCLSFPSTSLPMPVGIGESIRRKVPHPGLYIPSPDPSRQRPIQILVPNSDASGTGSSQSYSQPQYPSQSQQYQSQLSHTPAFPSTLANELKPGEASTPKEGETGDLERHSSTMSTNSPLRDDTDEQRTNSISGEFCIGGTDVNVENQREPDLSRPLAQNASKTEILEVGTSDTEEEAEVLQLSNRTETQLDTQMDINERSVDADQDESQLSVDDAFIHSALQNIPPRHSPHPAAALLIPHARPATLNTDYNPIYPPTQLSEPIPISQSSMHSLFSVSSEDERTGRSQAPISPNEDQRREETTGAQTPRHDLEAWKAPSFISKRKGKGKTVEKLDMPDVKRGKKRQRSVELESLVPKRTKVSRSESRQVASNQTSVWNWSDQETAASALGKKQSNNPPESTSPTDNTETEIMPHGPQLPEPRLANFVVDFEKIDLGKGIPIPRLNWVKDIKGTLLRTGRVRKFGEQVEKDGSVYIHL